LPALEWALSGRHRTAARVGPCSGGRRKHEFRWEDYRRGSDPRRPDSPSVRGPGHSATIPDQEGRTEADSDWGDGQVA
jgi:hypothetical protein